MDGGTPRFSTYLNGGAIVPTFIEDFQLASTTFFLESSVGQFATVHGVPVLDQSTYQSYASFVNSQDPLVIAAMALDPLSTSCTGADLAGWTLSLVTPDGGTVGSQAHMVYLGLNDLPSTTATSTTASGKAIFFDLDPSLTEVRLIAQNAGSGCVSADSDYGLVGVARVAPQSVSYIMHAIK